MITALTNPTRLAGEAIARSSAVAIPAGVVLPPMGEGDAWALWLSRLQFLTELTLERREYAHWINIHWRTNRLILGEKHRERINDMRDAGIIEVNPRYSTGRDGKDGFTKSYRLTAKYRKGQSVIHTLRTRPAMKKLEKTFMPDPQNLGPAGMHFAERIDEFVLAENALNFIDRTDYWAQANLARWISRQQFAVRCDYGRYHSLVTQTPKSTRPYLRTRSGDHLSIADVSACQPLLIGYLASTGAASIEDVAAPLLLPYGAGFLTQDAAANVRTWIALCEQGEIYRYFWKAIRAQPEPAWASIKTGNRKHVEVDLRDQSEKAFKRGSLVPLFDRQEATLQNPVFKIILRDFPSIAEWVLNTKRRGCEVYGTKQGHKLTACLCQRLESDLMIDGVGETLRTRYSDEPVQPIHDALLVRSQFARTAEQIIADQFGRLGLSPRIKSVAV